MSRGGRGGGSERREGVSKTVMARKKQIGQDPSKWLGENKKREKGENPPKRHHGKKGDPQKTTPQKNKRLLKEDPKRGGEATRTSVKRKQRRMGECPAKGEEGLGKSRKAIGNQARDT